MPCGDDSLGPWPCATCRRCGRTGGVHQGRHAYARISPSPGGFVRDPLRTVDCVYVPLLMSASRASDELSMAAVARGIENPVRRTCYLHIEMRRGLCPFAVFLLGTVGALIVRVVL